MKSKFSILVLAFFFISFAGIVPAGGNSLESGSISGRLLKSNGRPLAYTEIELVPLFYSKQVRDKRLWATSNAAGNFSFSEVPNGRYTLSINFDEKPSELSPYTTFFYPNTSNRREAEIFEIVSGKKITKLVFQLPPQLAQIKIIGKVVNAEGKPVPDAYVNLHDVEFDSLVFGFDLKTDKTGSFTLKGFEGRKYLVTAILVDKPPLPFSPASELIALAKSEILVLDVKTPALTLVLEPTKKMDRMTERSIGKLD
ncbi:MAG TPA: carboxypeptidase regulatory-like domain-containing protein [Pyrinomonadaceae bacterium]|nr:carboxypeptidase regulatory-like domain-containing protein [Pyrinomonadaceae bacterium]